MLNPELKAIYTPNVIEKLEVFAADMEKENRRVIVCFPEYYETIVYPSVCFIENTDFDSSYAIYSEYMPAKWIDEVSGNSNSLSPMGQEMDSYESEYEGVDLWVK